jgi:hypothetical protein
MVKFSLAGASVALAAVILAASANADPPPYPPRYGSSGTFGVLGQKRDELTSYIPPGHYRVQEAPGIFKAPGFWLRCNDIPCTPTNPGHIIATGEPGDDAIMEILPSDTAVYLFNVTLNFLG